MATSLPPAPGRIFINYRREETAFPAGWLYDRLAERFTDGQVFKDVDSIELGDDFVEVISTAVGSCDVLLALIGHEWLTITDQDGHRRLDDPNDFVRVEIEAALARNVRVIPILVEGARMPRATELPPSLAKLVRRQALELHPSRFDFDTGRLLRVLERTLAEVRTAEQGAVATTPPAETPPELSTTELPTAPNQQEQATPTPTAGIASDATSPAATPATAPAKPPDSSTTELPKAPERQEQATPTLTPTAGTSLAAAPPAATAPPPEPAPPTPPPPRLELSATVVDFGRLPQHSQPPERTVRIANAGGGTLNAQAATQASWLKLHQAGDELVISVDTTAVGQHEGTVTVRSDGGTATIRVTANMDPHPVPTPEPPTATIAQPPTTGQTTTDRVQQPLSRPAPPPADALPAWQVDQKAREPTGPHKAGKDYQGVILATWWQRVGAGLLDLLSIVVPAALLAQIGVEIGSYWGNVLGIPALLVIWLYNRCYLGGTTGQSWGKQASRLKLVRVTDNQPLGACSAFVRDLAHALDILTIGVGYLFPLWDGRRQTLADKVMGTVVISSDKTGSSGSQTPQTRHRRKGMGDS